MVTIFILPPSMAELRSRLVRRAEDKAEVIERRLANSRSEIERWTLYDYVLVNDDLQRTFTDVIAILSAERLKRFRGEAGVAAFVETLLREG